MGVAHTLAARALLRLPPETAHGLTLAGLAAGLGPKQRDPDDPILRTHLAGLPISNPIGLAAGFDKDARAPLALLAMGFGHVECGTTTPVPQPGNPRPRLFRLLEDRAVINRLGFNNAGHEVFAAGMARAAANRAGPVGANVGANKDSRDRTADYVLGMQRLWPLADWFTLNVSSPNTPGLRDLQQGSALEDLLGRVAEARLRLASGPSGDRPLFLKIAPDLEDAQAQTIAQAVLRFGLDGLIVSNTTLHRPTGLKSANRSEAGGLSGAPLFEPATRLLRVVREAAPALTLIGVGGVSSGAEAMTKLRAGASAVQLYTALALRGPNLVREIKRDLAARLRAEGFASVAEAVGAHRQGA